MQFRVTKYIGAGAEGEGWQIIETKDGVALENGNERMAVKSHSKLNFTLIERVSR